VEVLHRVEKMASTIENVNFDARMDIPLSLTPCSQYYCQYIQYFRYFVDHPDYFDSDVSFGSFAVESD
jgi:hypothetical protein